MKALILRADPQAAAETAQTLLDHGFQILTVDTQAVAHALIRIEHIDLLVMDERIEGQLTHAIALSGERRNPRLNALLLTDRPREETDDLFELIPCLHGLAGTTTAASLLGALAGAAMTGLRPDTQAGAGEDTEAKQVLAPIVLSQLVERPPNDDGENGAPCCADIAIAAPEMAEIAAQRDAMCMTQDADAPQIGQGRDRKIALARIDDAVDDELAALFLRHPSLPQRAAISGGLAKVI